MTENEEYKAMLKDLGITSSNVAKIIGSTHGSVKTQTIPSKELPRWAKLAVFVWKKMKK